MDNTTCLRQHKRLYTSKRRDKLPHLIEKYGMKCYWCGCHLKPESLTIDHYIPLSKGGSNKIKNLRLACNGCNNKRGNVMPQETLQTIAEQSKICFPSHWKKPKYHLGQGVHQGEIIGLEYHPPGTRRAYDLGEGWTYTLLIDEYSNDVELCTEREIKPLEPSELREEVQTLIDLYQSKITALTEQLEGENNGL
jgi:hypothetical protein